jgi:hypothetical protein
VDVPDLPSAARDTMHAGARFTDWRMYPSRTAALQEVASGFAAAGANRRRAARNLAFLSRCADAGILSKGVICMGCQSGLKGRQQGW